FDGRAAPSPRRSSSRALRRIQREATRHACTCCQHRASLPVGRDIWPRTCLQDRPHVKTPGFSIETQTWRLDALTPTSLAPRPGASTAQLAQVFHTRTTWLT